MGSKLLIFYFCMLRYSQVPRLDLDKLYEEITLDVLYHNDFRPQTANSPQKKDNSSSRFALLSQFIDCWVWYFTKSRPFSPVTTIAYPPYYDACRRVGKGRLGVYVHVCHVKSICNA